MPARRLFHTGADGALWSLIRADGEVFILHEDANGRADRLGLPAFLAGDEAAPERRAFQALLATLVAADAPAVTGRSPEAGAAAAEPSPGEEGPYRPSPRGA